MDRTTNEKGKDDIDDSQENLTPLQSAIWKIKNAVRRVKILAKPSKRDRKGIMNLVRNVKIDKNNKKDDDSDDSDDDFSEEYDSNKISWDGDSQKQGNGILV